MMEIDRLFLAIIVSILISAPLPAQQLNHRQGEVIVCLHPDTDRNSLARRHSILENKDTRFELTTCLSSDLNIWKATFDYTKIHEQEFLAALNRDPGVAVAQLNHLIKRRNLVPDDPMFAEQWQWLNDGTLGIADSDIDAEEAWSVSTGGVTLLGDTIVVAVIDVGVDYMHEDIRENIWMNRQEIPGNRIDDDGNGYVDDVRGWNVLLENDNIEPELFGGGVQETHGTEILGIVGAVGNNGIGVAGVNWNIKLMNVFFNSDLNEADMIAAYGYILAQRKLYNETNGQKGAFVVATNLSYGDEDLNPDETPIWCAVYDSLGQHGILNCTATANTSIDIDSIGDVPTSCNSEYMISVTATNSSDQRTFAAYGKNDIDLAAPGSQLLSTSIPGYDYVTGTSYASPMVAGAIGLLYASPCGDLAGLARTDPAGAALKARSLILDQVDKIASLADDVATGGRLNVFNALNQTLVECQSCIAPFEIVAQTGDDFNSAAVSWQQADSVTRVDFSWRLQGDTIWMALEDVTSPLSLDGLASCTTYEYLLEATCQDGTSVTTAVMNFTTGGCCLPVTSITASDKTDSTLALSWQGSGGDAGYILIYGAQEDSILWDTMIFTQGEQAADLTGLTGCTDYLVFIQTVCSGSGTEISDTFSFRTFGCGPCLDSVYCVLPVNAVGDEWIERLTLNTIDVTSGYDLGYGDYTGNSTQLKQGNSYTMTITPGFDADTLEEHYFAWIDFNQNGLFDGEDEQVFASDTATSSVLEARISIPEDAPPGLTRLRVMMLFDPIEDVVSGCTTEIDLGEAEDYCVEIVIDSLLCYKPEGLDTMDFQGTSTLIVWEPVDSAIAYIIRHRKVGEDWTEVVDTTNMFEMMELEECEEYEVQVQAVCGRDTSGYTESLIFPSFCSTSSEEVTLHIRTTIQPNPFDQYLNLQIESEQTREAEIRILQLNGQMMSRRNIRILTGTQTFDLPEATALPPGMYLLTLQTNDGRMVRKIMRQ